MQTWQEAQEWEAEWHGNCVNSYNEETKQYIYSRFLGLDVYKVNTYGQVGWDFGDISVIDIGCGPYSLLMKSDAKLKIGVEPCDYPEWVKMRYAAANVTFIQQPAEEFVYEGVADEVLIYNCLQHVINPEKIIQNVLSYSKIVRIFEWVNNGVSDGHLHDLIPSELNRWLGGVGKSEFIDIGPCVGEAYWGIFKGNHF